MKKRVLFYSNNLDSTYAQKFYTIDFDIIRSLGYELTVTDKRLELFKFWKYDIFFAYFYTRSFFRALPLALWGKKIFFTGGIDSFDRNTVPRKVFVIQKVFFWLCYQIATKCIVVSDNDWENIETIYNGRLRRKLVKSYHVIDVERFVNEDFKRDNIFVTICWQGVMRNIKRKGLEKSLEIYKYLVEKPEFKDSKYLILGRKGDATPHLEGIIKDLGLERYVTITGEVSEDEKISILKKSKYYFQLSTYEGFGLAALEAEAAGNIVIHSNRGGLKYVVGDNGLIISLEGDNDIDKIYRKIINFDSAKLKDAQSWVRSNFTYEKRRNDFEKIMK